MLYSGITRDMFLVSCNPQFSQIRHLVIAGFAELGRCEIKDEQNTRLSGRTLQKIKDKVFNRSANCSHMCPDSSEYPRNSSTSFTFLRHNGRR